MLTNNKIKFINSLRLKKNRDLHQTFVVEGDKVVGEFIASDFEVIEVYSTSTSNFQNATIVSASDLKRITNFKTPSGVIALVKKPNARFESSILRKQVSLVLDNINDPGNLGTIIRIADWFGVKNVVCSTGSVDVFNSKVVQASMGSLCRVDVFYWEIEKLLRENIATSYGALLEGQHIYDMDPLDEGLIVLGNESNGITPVVRKLLNKKITIPRVGQAESLNVGVSAGIICGQLVRAR